MNANDLGEKMAIAAAGEYGKESAKQTMGWLGAILRPPAEELGGLLADRVKIFRLRTQYKVLEKARLIHSEFNLEAQQVPVKVVAQLLDYCSWEEDEWMQARWAYLLANAATDGTPLDIYISLIDIMKQLSSTQVQCLAYMYSEKRFPARRRGRILPSYQNKDAILRNVNVSEGEYIILCESLIRNNLIRSFQFSESEHAKGPAGGLAIPEKVETQYEFDEITLTHLGVRLIRTCRLPIMEAQLDKIASLYEPHIEIYARKGHDDEIISSLTALATDIYQYIDDQDIISSVWSSLSCLYESDIDKFKLPPYTGKSIGHEKKIEIISGFKWSLRRLHSW